MDYVICTHLHLDHVGWNTRLAGDKWVPTFPNARYIFGRREYEFRHALWQNGEIEPGEENVRARESRRRVLNECAEQGHLLLSSHWPSPHVGHITSDGNEFKLKPGV